MSARRAIVVLELDVTGEPSYDEVTKAIEWLSPPVSICAPMPIYLGQGQYATVRILSRRIELLGEAVDGHD